MGKNRELMTREEISEKLLAFKEVTKVTEANVPDRAAVDSIIEVIDKAIERLREYALNENDTAALNEKATIIYFGKFKQLENAITEAIDKLIVARPYVTDGLADRQMMKDIALLEADRDQLHRYVCALEIACEAIAPVAITVTDHVAEIIRAYNLKIKGLVVEEDE